jgi:hypothetical protein
MHLLEMGLKLDAGEKSTNIAQNCNESAMIEPSHRFSGTGEALS